jgi:ATP-dependent Clp protease ATP-binding subunit ClpA
MSTGRRDPISLGLRDPGDEDRANKNRDPELALAEMKERLRVLEPRLKEEIFGQDPAIEAFTSALIISYAGLREEDKPIGSFLFLGPTGSGKTEVTIQLAKLLDYKFLRIDMSEFKQAHQVSRLVGSPPGYVGAEIAGQLTSFVAKNPKCVVLLDEIEKAHPDVYDLLLQIMDHAKLTDGKNNVIDFSKAIVVMTSNLGAQQKQKTAVGIQAPVTGSSQEQAEARNDMMVKKIFSPEFRNRLDEVIEFKELTPEVIGLITNKFIKKLETQLATKNVKIAFTNEARRYIADNGFDRQMGARPLGRFLTKEVRKVVGPEIVFGKLQNGGSVEVSLMKNEKGKDKLAFVFNAAAVNDNQKPAAPAQTQPAPTSPPQAAPELRRLPPYRPKAPDDIL